MTGGKGNDIFVYDLGNDVITDYTAGHDSIKINGNISNISYKGKNVIFTIGNGSLIVNNAKGKNIAVLDNNDSRTYSGTFDLFCDDNFISNDININSVANVYDKNYSVGKLQYSDNDDKFIADSLVYHSSFDD